jgi:hypothetical protein
MTMNGRKPANGWQNSRVVVGAARLGWAALPAQKALLQVEMEAAHHLRVFPVAHHPTVTFLRVEFRPAVLPDLDLPGAADLPA